MIDSSCQTDTPPAEVVDASRRIHAEGTMNAPIHQNGMDHRSTVKPAKQIDVPAKITNVSQENLREKLTAQQREQLAAQQREQVATQQREQLAAQPRGSADEKNPFAKRRVDDRRRSPERRKSTHERVAKSDKIVIEAPSGRNERKRSRSRSKDKRHRERKEKRSHRRSHSKEKDRHERRKEERHEPKRNQSDRDLREHLKGAKST